MTSLFKLHGSIIPIVVFVVLGQANTRGQSPNSIPPTTPTGFYFPLNLTYGDDTNWLTCGIWYYPGLRHNGSDLVARETTPVYAIAPGKLVSKSGPEEKSGWGIGNYALVIRHSSTNGNFLAIYGHIKTNLKIGDEVVSRQVIGTIGRYQEHDSRGKLIERVSHLHFGIFPSGYGFPSSGWGRVRDPNCTEPNNTNGFVAPISFISTRSPANQPRSADTKQLFNLNGEWIGSGYYPGPWENRVRIRHVGTKVEAVKVNGSATVPAGQVTWYGEYTTDSFYGKLQIADENYRNPRWARVLIHVLNKDQLTVNMVEDDPVTGRRDWGPLAFRRIK